MINRDESVEFFDVVISMGLQMLRIILVAALSIRVGFLPMNIL